MSGAERVAAVSVVDLRTDFVVLPLGVMTPQPQLSWRIEANRRGVWQSAYRIEVSSRPEALARGHIDLWDSGRVASARSTAIRYGGMALSSRQRCYWRVRIWDESGAPAAPSVTAWWEMGLLKRGDWSAEWLAAEDQTMRADRQVSLCWIKGPVAAPGQAAKYRLGFSTRGSAQATCFVSAYGRSEVWMDGVPVATDPGASIVLGPWPTKEVTLPLAEGRHALCVAVAAPDPRISAFGFPAGEMASFVRVQETDGEMRRLNGREWKTALSDAPNWKSIEFDDGQWENACLVNEARPPLWPKQPAFLLRREFEVRKAARCARVYATALGVYELWLNGERVGDALLTPESTDFRRRALYRVYDVTDQMLKGVNVLGALVGDGWYASYTVIVGRYPWGPPPRCLLAQLEVTYADGSREVIGSGSGWQLLRAPIISSEIYDGEQYDARLEQRGWSAAGFDASNWESASVVPAPPAALISQISPPIRRQKSLTVCAMTEPLPGVFVFDFGQNFAGWCRLKVTGPAGTAVEMRFAELLAENGEIDPSNLRLARQTDTYILKGDPAGETFEPHFTYHGFRYVQLSGFPGVPGSDSLTGIVIHSDLEITGRVDTDSPVINGLSRNALWSQRSNFMGIPTDCPQRDERMGWMGDANVFWDAAAFNMDVASFTRRFMGDVRDSQADNGAFSEFSPAAYRDPPGAAGSWDLATCNATSAKLGAAPGWADAGVRLPWTVWRRYGDTGIIDENWASMTRYLRFIADSNPDFIWRNNRGPDYGDWLALDAKSPGDGTTPKDLIATAMWAQSASCMGQMAEATERTEEACSYRALWTKLASAFQKRFISADGTVGNGSQTSYILALRCNLIPNDLRAIVAARLVADIERRGTLLSTGFLGTPDSLDVLAEAGYGELVYSLLLRTAFPSWGYMVENGATTIWERWNSDTGDVSMNSFNHYALGAVCGFVFRRVAGIAELEPGFRKIEVRPVVDPRVRAVSGEYNSAIGRIATRWRRHDSGGLELELSVPPNSAAAVHLPAARNMTVKEGGRPISGHPDICAVRYVDDGLIVEVRSGLYRFSVTEKASDRATEGSHPFEK